jgi:hypothetical protein
MRTWHKGMMGWRQGKGGLLYLHGTGRSGGSENPATQNTARFGDPQERKAGISSHIENCWGHRGHN